MKFNLKKYALVALKGVGMGAADVIPGVSGGTIAFMTGIYEELVGSIHNFDKTAFKLFFTGKFREFWKHINGTFLVSVLVGILVSIFSLAKLMTWLLENHPIQTWAFFFGLIVASSIFILRGISGWKFKDVVLTVLGVGLGAVLKDIENPKMQFKEIYESGDNRLDLIGKYTRITNNLYAMNKWMDKYDEVYKKSVGNDFPVLRYPDILLMYAEALGRQTE